MQIGITGRAKDFNYLTHVLTRYRSSEGDTPLHVSAAYGRCDVLRLLLQSGANPDVYNQVSLNQMRLDLALRWSRHALWI